MSRPSPSTDEDIKEVFVLGLVCRSIRNLIRSRLRTGAIVAILADEPTGNLDSKTGLLIVELLHSLSQEGKTVVVATHGAAIATKADMILEMEDGKLIVESG